MDKLVKLIAQDKVWDKWVAANSAPSANKQGCISRSKQGCISRSRKA
ncbi:hypothetical protein [Amycolatopsis samaneae]|uniref:Uncharacterized protein n=1 Tax=Amycolatopsis samaneae TaxID=664691 RepID=A0ABW5GCM2_9PSEU